MSEVDVNYEMLIAFAAGELGGADAERVAAYVSANPNAAATVSRFRGVIDAGRNDDSVAPPTSLLREAYAIFKARTAKATLPAWVESLKQIVASLVFDSRPQHATAGMRGVGMGYQLSYEFEQGEIDLDVEPIAGDGAGERRVMGQVTAQGADAAPAISLVGMDAETATLDAAADDRGMFRMNVRPGRYEMYVKLSDSVVAVRDVEIS